MKFVVCLFSLAEYLLLMVAFVDFGTLTKQTVALIFYLTLKAGTYLACVRLT